MLGDLTAATDIYLVCGYTDMRKSIDGLRAIVEGAFHLDSRNHSLFLFCGRRCDRIKALLWEGDGYVLLYKRLDVERGRYRWPRNKNEVRNLTWTGSCPALTSNSLWRSAKEIRERTEKETRTKIFHARLLFPKGFFHPASNCTCRRDTNGYGRGRACSAADRIYRCGNFWTRFGSCA